MHRLHRILHRLFRKCRFFRAIRSTFESLRPYFRFPSHYIAYRRLSLQSGMAWVVSFPRRHPFAVDRRVSRTISYAWALRCFQGVCRLVVHFTAKGSGVLTDAVDHAIQKALEEPREEDVPDASSSINSLERCCFA